MPNPLIKPGIANQSHREQVDREAIQPEPEHYAGTNLAYRGVQYHGVEPTFTTEPMPEYDDDVEIIYEELEPQQDPVPVRVVNRVERFQRMARADSFTLQTTDVPVQVAARDETRVSLRIVNTHATDVVYVGFAQNMTRAMFSYPLIPKTDVVLTTKDPVWVVATAATVVGWIGEYEIPVDDD